MIPKITDLSIFKDPDLQKKRIGEGVYGVVFKCTLKDGNRPVALKKIQKQEGDEDVFEEEKEIHSQLKHPNIIELLGYINNQETYGYLVLELAQMDLSRYLTKNKNDARFPATCRSYALDITRGLCFMHDKKVSHGDLKGANVLIVAQSDGKTVAKIADFGASHSLITLGIPTKNHETALKIDILNLALTIFPLLTKDLTEKGAAELDKYTQSTLVLNLFTKSFSVSRDVRPTAKIFLEVMENPETTFANPKSKKRMADVS